MGRGPDRAPRATRRSLPANIRTMRRSALRASWELRYLVQTAPPADGWHELAACRPPAEFLSLSPTAAQAMCDGCPVRLDCLREARRHDDAMNLHHVPLSVMVAGLPPITRARLQRQLRGLS